MQSKKPRLVIHLLLFLAFFLTFGCDSTPRGRTAQDGVAVYTADASVNGRSAALDWQPAKTRIFVAGLLEWEDSDSLSSFDPRNRRDAELVAFFLDKGVPAAQIVYLQDRQATTLKIHESLKQLLAASAEDEMLVVYYCGHGYKDNAGRGYFASYDTGAGNPGWAIDSIPTMIEKHFKGGRAILAADCCYSGVLVQETKRLGARVSYAVFASSSASEISTANWTFTEALLDSLRGRAGSDLNSDGFVTLEETGLYITQDMLIGEEQMAAVLISGSFTPGTRLAAAEPKSDPSIGQRVSVQWQGQPYNARITGVEPGRFMIHWLGFRDYPDEWVNASQVSFASGQTEAASGFQAGAVVEVQWKGRWYPANVLETRGNVYYIHYAGYDDSWDEWVSSSRIRKPRS